ncbi:MAG: hypothetical protein EOP51_19130, partial [Sphingobacteriales bacterium]
MKKLSLILLAGMLAPFVVAAQSSKKDTMAVVKGVTAHRGYSAAFPENTLPSFQGGVDAHADWVELDIFKTKDGKVVVCHDATTNRTGDKNLVIADVTYQELLEVDVATDFRKRNNLTLAQCPVQRIPLLSEAVALIMKQKRTHLSIQPKADIVAEAIEVVKAAKAEKM